jgi:hypothetical protein
VTKFCEDQYAHFIPLQDGVWGTPCAVEIQLAEGGVVEVHAQHHLYHPAVCDALSRCENGTPQWPLDDRFGSQMSKLTLRTVLPASLCSCAHVHLKGITLPTIP